VSLDRTAFRATPEGGGTVELWTGERVRAAGTLPVRDGTVSIEGTFLARDVLRVDRLVEHEQDRDWPSYVALLLLAVVWARPLWPPGRAARRTA
jgi:hypothetical protein